MLGDLSHTLFLRISRRAYCFFNIEPERLRQSGSDFSCLPFILIMAICSAGSSFPFAILAFIYSLCFSRYEIPASAMCFGMFHFTRYSSARIPSTNQIWRGKKMSNLPHSRQGIFPAYDMPEPLHAFRMACSSLFCTQRLLLKNGKVTYPLLVHKSPDVY